MATMIPVRGWGRAIAASAIVLALSLGSSAEASSPGPRAVSVSRAAHAFPDGDWLRFDYNAQRSGVGPADTGISRQNLGQLTLRRVTLDGTVDSSPIQLHAVEVGGRKRDVVIVTTTYGRTIALDPGTGAKLWEYVPRDIKSYEGSAQITTATPIADPDRLYVYAPSPDGLIHKLAVATGDEILGTNWPARVTYDGGNEKIDSALNISGSSLVVVTASYFDSRTYQGHVVLIDRASGRITAVWNSLCSHRHQLLVPSSCSEVGSGIWGRAGAVIEPRSRRILVATGNGPFNGSTDWGDSVLELSSDGRHLLHNWTPTNQAQLNTGDLDIGSTAPALLPEVQGRRLAVQGGKDGILRLLDLDRLDGTTGPAGPRLGGELQDIAGTTAEGLYSAPAVWRHDRRTYVFVGTVDSTRAYVLGGGLHPRLHVAWRRATKPFPTLESHAPSPVLAGGLVYVYHQKGSIEVFEPTSGRTLATLPIGYGHWQSPIVIGGRVIVPEGSANQYKTTGVLDIYHLPGR